jgi:hypothetical protein
VNDILMNEGRRIQAELNKAREDNQRLGRLCGEMATRLKAIRDQLETIVCTKDPDMGVVMLDQHAPTHFDTETGMSTYDLEYFSPLGGALIEAWLMTDPEYEGKPSGT